ncbi:MAG: hypothetical protein KA028_00190 [Candidatus Pacebacteria bacterium]|nr:hypothetical protein [Candidatus Paceibacterota bacterium]MBP9851842.1 hypothetical protein [Candidatus Paceibacterota bacterium]
MKDTKFAAGMITLVVIALVSFFSWYIPHYSMHSLKATAVCNDIYKEKAPGYFGADANNRYIFNQDMNTCLLLNTVADEVTGENRFIIVDMIHDDIAFYYELPKGETKDANLGLTKDEAVEKVRSFGFIVF